jgi:hypothetical protein
MLALPGLRAFSVSADRASGGICCGPDGVFVGNVPLLVRADAGGERCLDCSACSQA